jgi:hypothetical protein
MYEFGEQMQRARLRRLHPDATEDEIDADIGSWLLSRPGAPLGDAEGRPSHRVRMNRLEAALRRVADDLEKQGHRWALAGGFAVSARDEPRFTQDVDIAVSVDGDRSTGILRLRGSSGR